MVIPGRGVSFLCSKRRLAAHDGVETSGRACSTRFQGLAGQGEVVDAFFRAACRGQVLLLRDGLRGGDVHQSGIGPVAPLQRPVRPALPEGERQGVERGAARALGLALRRVHVLLQTGDSVCCASVTSSAHRMSGTRPPRPVPAPSDPDRRRMRGGLVGGGHGESETACRPVPLTCLKYRPSSTAASLVARAFWMSWMVGDVRGRRSRALKPSL
jgi:hypothetical protein